eukprot:CAMPEP_0177265602 /NCGR_PEP_ID=MMETSP0367-20130122/62211_1 /TAXON_ID=447022 ORGANISM="Scrippsiella hangoei-like, Strain SHHI-4" /NCGR_SAMPLE_ID=MMETSP0367 /ASSEMBLY_ACC=CAM_ASM_000362 /LENGTH=31 /DNA_ID= /DNA_START= /DNA_END= /DNA_ORIENTATION=
MSLMPKLAAHVTYRSTSSTVEMPTCDSKQLF